MLENRGQADEAFILRMLATLRDARVWLPGEGRQGVSSVEFHRVILTTGQDGVGLELRAAAAK